MSGKYIPDWDKNRFTDPFGKERKKDRKDRYDNISGWTGEPLGIIKDTEDILRQSRENDNAIGEAAKQLAKPDPALNIPEVSALKPQPRTVIPPCPDRNRQTGIVIKPL